MGEDSCAEQSRQHDEIGGHLSRIMLFRQREKKRGVKGTEGTEQEERLESEMVWMSE